MQHPTARPWITAGVALAGAGLIAITPVATPLPDVHAPDIQLAAADYDITLDFVRHGQSTDNAGDILGTTPPGAPLTALGQQQAITVGQDLYNGGDNDIDDVYASGFLRAQQTAWPLVQLLQGSPTYDDIPGGPPPLFDPSQILPGLNELNAGLLDGIAGGGRLTQLAYILPPLMWTLGLYFVPQWGSTIDPFGMAFENRFSDAVDHIYDQSDPDADQVAFSHAAAIMVWTMMNVKNPDPLLILLNPLENTGQVVVEGNPTDGWTLTSWNGQAIDPDPGLMTELFVDFRDLIVAPQMAVWNVWEALLTLDPAQVVAALQTGVVDVATTTLNFPVAVIGDIVGAITGGGLGDLLPAAATDLAGLASGDVGALVGDALTAI